VRPTGPPTYRPLTWVVPSVARLLGLVI